MVAENYPMLQQVLFVHSVTTGTVPAHHILVSNLRNSDYNNPNGTQGLLQDPVPCTGPTLIFYSSLRPPPWISAKGFVVLHGKT